MKKNNNEPAPSKTDAKVLLVAGVGAAVDYSKDICKCGHNREYHSKINSRNYTDGKCKTTKCNCQYFIIKQLKQ